MASGDTLFIWKSEDGCGLPSSNYATPDTRNARACWDFDASTDESILIHGKFPQNYAGGGVDIYLTTRASTATSGSARWQTAFEEGTTDIDSDSFATANSGSTTANGTSGIATTSAAINHTDGAQMDSVGAGDEFWLKVTRDADGTSGTDDQTGDSELFVVEIREH